MKYPKYLKNKIKEVKKHQVESEASEKNLVVWVLIENEDEKRKFPDVQMECIKEHLNCLPGLSIEEFRSCLL